VRGRSPVNRGLLLVGLPSLRGPPPNRAVFTVLRVADLPAYRADAAVVALVTFSRSQRQTDDVRGGLGKKRFGVMPVP
jgi:hypothetical protein